jgi:uncharacterized membrane protein YhaH (DUF805 family)
VPDPTFENSELTLVEEEVPHRQQSPSENGSRPLGTRAAHTYEYRDPTQPIHLFSTEGRMGRLRYLFWLMVLWVLMVLLLIVGEPVLKLSPGGHLWVNVMVLRVALVEGLVLKTQRFHDINWSGWSCLFLLIPGVNLILELMLILRPGTPEMNDFGEPPPPTPAGITITVFVLLIGMLVTILFAGPSYRDAVKRAKEQSTGQTQDNSDTQDLHPQRIEQ